jgi:macrodomain Ter protein organizer (MatP/YcbG family)
VDVECGWGWGFLVKKFQQDAHLFSFVSFFVQSESLSFAQTQTFNAAAQNPLRLARRLATATFFAEPLSNLATAIAK